MKLHVRRSFGGGLRSLSARRAWIETWMCTGNIPVAIVALRKEGVD